MDSEHIQTVCTDITKITGKITQYKASGVENCLSDNTIHKIYEGLAR